MSESLCCPKCGSTNLRGPSPAQMEDDDWRVVCRICLARCDRNVARCEFIRRYDPRQGQTDKPLSRS